MEKRTFKITLADGTALEGLTLNGNNYISDKKVTEDVFRDNLSIYINQKTLDSLEKDCRTKLVLPDSVMKADNLKLLD